ncbi:ANR family transcriptional regulator [Serratia proteamaculans]|uniref:ANR family transcriptional regulator n=1 Tax=Serratia proteamaculans TaxID=28151 RepID=UPI0021BDDE28|nr:ANR family transcriptional regulator [Serratia proteamaculans]
MLSTRLEGGNTPMNDVNEMMTSTRALYRQLSATAASLERAGIYPEAAEQWRQAGQVAPGAKSRFWCEVRQARCLREIPREVHSYGQANARRARKPASGERLG